MFEFNLNNKLETQNQRKKYFRDISYLSVLKGDAGKPSLLYRFGFTGLSAQAYLTYIGSVTSSFHTITLSPSIFALAQTNFLSAPAMANSLSSSPSFVIKPPPVWLKVTVILLFSIFDD